MSLLARSAVGIAALQVGEDVKPIPDLLALIPLCAIFRLPSMLRLNARLTPAWVTREASIITPVTRMRRLRSQAILA